MPFPKRKNQRTVSLSIPKAVHTAAKQEAIRAGLSLSALLGDVLIGGAQEPHYKARASTNGAAPVRPSVTINLITIAKAETLARGMGITPTTLMSQIVVQHFTRPWPAGLNPKP